MDVTEETCIWADNILNQSSVTVNSAPTETRVVTGIINLRSLPK